MSARRCPVCGSGPLAASQPVPRNGGPMTATSRITEAPPPPARPLGDAAGCPVPRESREEPTETPPLVALHSAAPAPPAAAVALGLAAPMRVRAHCPRARATPAHPRRRRELRYG